MAQANMRPIHEVVTRIRSILRQGVPASPDELRALAADYQGHCAAAQSRLQQCVELLSRGLRSEAIHLADSPPSLLELTGELDFPESGYWRAWAAPNGLPVPAEFDRNQLFMLDTEYAQYAQTEPLLNLYRRMCIKQAPTHEKIQVLRRLRLTDPENPNWVSDLRALEQNRFREIAQVVARDREAMSEEQASALAAELTDPHLVQTPPGELRAEVLALNLRLRSERLRSTLQGLSEQALAAYANQDFAAANQAVCQIDDLSAAEQVPVPADIVEATREARAWCLQQHELIRAQQEFEQECAALSSGIASGEEAEQLQRRLARVQAFGWELPPGLETRARQRIIELHRRTHWRKQVKVLSVAVVALAAVILGAAITLLVLDRRDRREIAERIRTATRTLDVAAGRSLVDQLQHRSPRRLSDPQIMAAVADFQKVEAAEKQRTGEMAEALKQAWELAADDPQAPGFVKTAERLARTDKEKQDLAAFRGRLENRRKAAQQETDARATAALREASARYEAVKAAKEPEQIEALALEMDALVAKAEAVGNASAPLLAQAKELRQKHGAERQRAADLLRKRKEREQAMAAMREDLELARAKLPDISAYAAALTELEKKHAARAEQGIALPSQLVFWQALLPAYETEVQVERMIGECLTRQPKGPLEAPAAEVFADLRERIGGIKADAPTPHAGVLQSMRARVKQAAEFEEHSAALRELLQNGVLRGTVEFTVKLRDGRPVRYYAPEGAKVEGVPGGVQATHYDSRNVTKENALILGTLEAGPAPAPHAKLALELEGKLEAEIKSPGFQSGLPEMMALVVGYKDANPRVKVMLLSALVTLNDAQGNPAELNDELRREFRELSPEAVQYLAPGDDANVSAALAAVARKIETLRPAFIDYVKAVREKSEASLRLPLVGLYRRLAITATAGVGAEGQPLVLPIGGKIYGEYWSIELRDSKPVFVIVASGDAQGKVQWVSKARPPAPGQPLLSPLDGRDTAAVLRHHRKPEDLPVPENWPVNLETGSKPAPNAVGG